MCFFSCLYDVYVTIELWTHRTTCIYIFLHKHIDLYYIDLKVYIDLYTYKHYLYQIGYSMDLDHIKTVRLHHVV